MICEKCKKDHSVRNEGPLTVCEMRAYRSMGSPARDEKSRKYNAFGVGTRYQFDEAK